MRSCSIVGKVRQPSGVVSFFPQPFAQLSFCCMRAMSFFLQPVLLLSSRPLRLRSGQAPGEILEGQALSWPHVIIERTRRSASLRKPCTPEMSIQQRYLEKCCSLHAAQLLITSLPFARSSVPVSFSEINLETYSPFIIAGPSYSRFLSIPQLLFSICLTRSEKIKA